MFTARNGEEVTVTADQAHAWAEYYEPLLGTWIVLEATPADLGEDPVPTETEPPTEAPPVIPEETTGTPETEPETPETEPETPETSGKDEVPPEAPERKPLNFGWLRWLLLPVLILGTLEGQRWLRIRLRHRRRRTGHPLYPETGCGSGQPPGGLRCQGTGWAAGHSSGDWAG